MHPNTAEHEEKATSRIVFFINLKKIIMIFIAIVIQMIAIVLVSSLFRV